MANIPIYIVFLCLLVGTPYAFASLSPSQHAELVVRDVQRQLNASRRNLAYLSCGTGNPIDDCWRCDSDWVNNRQKLADCAIGFGRNAVGGKGGRFYLVTDPSDDDPKNPKPGTLRHAVIQHEPLWIIFKHDMVITLKDQLVMNSYKTIDGRGASVHVTGLGCIIIHQTSNIIIHGIHIHDCKPSASGMVSVSPSHAVFMSDSDGDGITIRASRDIWVDHCSLASCYDGLIDATHASTYITISNNYMTHHNKVMLLGHTDTFVQDKNMQVTVAFNHFGEGLVQRMPRCRHGYFHVVNNDYTQWELYAIGGSAAPTIFSEGNRFLASDDPSKKEVTRHQHAPESEWRHWNWKSEGDLMLNGAFFRQSGAGAASTYARANSLSARPSRLVGSMTRAAGVLSCKKGSRC
ncbi:hypothetical protein Cgig2_006232 [Carnegiea gigantea]|uniref:Pectate lyase n=1 Tax=Carnegiea gigantea TaxID=171969 RepID=A0A9Q1GNN6_9CARY|nr:hypothetical protein Cgig2_006232 [Carnegiea gigantea]